MALTSLKDQSLLPAANTATTDEIVIRDVSVAAGTSAAKRMTLAELVVWLNANGISGSGGGRTLTEEQVQDIVGAMVTGNTETNLTVSYDDPAGKINFVLDAETVQDIVGAMFDGNTETGITATYQDSDGTIDLVITGAQLVTILEGLSAGSRLSYNRLDDTPTLPDGAAAWARLTGPTGTAPKDRLPTDTVYDADIDTLFSSAIGSGTSFTLTRVDGATTTINFAESIRDLVAGFLRAGTDISVTHDDVANTLTIGFTGTGAGSGRTDVQVQELARDAIAAALRGAATGPRVTVTADDVANTITLTLSDLPDGAATWARATGATGTAPKARLPSDTVYDADIADLIDCFKCWIRSSH